MNRSNAFRNKIIFLTPTIWGKFLQGREGKFVSVCFGIVIDRKFSILVISSTLWEGDYFIPKVN